MPRHHNRVVLESYEFTLGELLLKLPDKVDESRVSFSAESWGAGGAAEIKVVHRVPFTPEEEAAADAADEKRRIESQQSIERRERETLKQLLAKYGQPNDLHQRTDLSGRHQHEDVRWLVRQLHRVGSARR